MIDTAGVRGMIGSAKTRNTTIVKKIKRTTSKENQVLHVPLCARMSSCVSSCPSHDISISCFTEPVMERTMLLHQSFTSATTQFLVN